MPTKKAIVQIGKIERRILLIRGEKVIIDADLAEFYGVPTKRLNEQVKRNKERFPRDFIFQLTANEKAEVVANCDHLSKLKYSKALAYAFTDHDDQIIALVHAIKELMNPELPPKKRQIGFHTELEEQA